MRIALFSVALLLGGCIVEAPPRYAPAPEPVPAAPVADVQPSDEPPVVDEDPPVSEPPPVVVAFAPPPLLVEVPPPMPFGAAVWVGGYWVWQGNWVWAHGHWMGPPQPDLVWMHPYYEHRGDMVVFVNGYWSHPGVAFVPPPPTLRLVAAPVAVGVVIGPRPIGPAGCFIPAPPGSRAGIIVPAPIGTAPAVVTSAPAVFAPGMRVNANVHVDNSVHVTNVTNVTNVTIVAPAGVTANGHAFNTSVPAAPHLAASRPALVAARAPMPNANHQWGNGQTANGGAGHGQGPGQMREPMPVRPAGPATQPSGAHGAPPAPPMQAMNRPAPHGPMPVNEPPPRHAGNAHPAPAPHPVPQTTNAKGGAGAANGNPPPNKPNAQSKPPKSDPPEQHKKGEQPEH